VEFIPMAEETGLVVPLGYWVLREVCRQIQTWSAIPEMRDLSVAINLSSRHINVPDVVEQLLAITLEYGVDPAKIELEPTETTLMTEPEAARDVFLRLKACGFRLTIDDFGTGYSSLSYLQRFPVDRLKIDRSFLKDTAASPDTESIIRAIIDLARHLNMEVVAEGIERPKQLEQLTAMDCEFGQGFLFSKPMAPEPVERLLRQEAAVVRRG